MADYAQQAPANRNPGTSKPCMDCGKDFTSYIPINLMWRPQRCPGCLVEHDRRRWEERRSHLEALPDNFETRRAARARYRAKHPNQPTRAAPAIPIAELWPFGATGWPYEAVNERVPRGMREELRADVCQELCLMLVAGEIEEAEIAVAMRRVIRNNYGEWALSLDWQQSDGHKIADTLGYDQEI